MTETTCPICEGNLQLIEVTRPVRMGARKVEVSYNLLRCPRCGEELLTPEQIDNVQERAANAIRDQDGLLRPAEIRGMRQQLGFTQAQLEHVLGTGPKTVARWEGGTVCQSAVADRTLRFFAAYPHLVPFYGSAAAPVVASSQLQTFNSLLTGAGNIAISGSMNIITNLETGPLDQMTLDLSTSSEPTVPAVDSGLALAA